MARVKIFETFQCLHPDGKMEYRACSCAPGNQHLNSDIVGKPLAQCHSSTQPSVMCIGVYARVDDGTGSHKMISPHI